VTEKVIPVGLPLVQVTLTSAMCQETFLCGLMSTLPVGIGVLFGNDICVDTPVTEVNSQAAQYRQIEAQATT